MWLCKRCGACKSKRYCSPACQKDDWHEHKDECGKDKGLPLSNPKSSEQMKARCTGEIEDGVFLDRLTEQELHTWNNESYWSENEKHLLQELWKTFERDGQVPIEDRESRSVREMFKWLGSQVKRREKRKFALLFPPLSKSLPFTFLHLSGRNG